MSAWFQVHAIRWHISPAPRTEKPRDDPREDSQDSPLTVGASDASECERSNGQSAHDRQEENPAPRLCINPAAFRCRFGRMPPHDPCRCPVLERAMPADAVPGGEIRFARDPWLVLFGDGTWRQVSVRTWRKDRYGRDVTDVEWHPNGETWGESYLYDPERMRPFGNAAAPAPAGETEGRPHVTDEAGIQRYAGDIPPSATLPLSCVNGFCVTSATGTARGLTDS